MAFAALFMTQCSKQHEPMANEPSGETMEVTVRVDNSAAKTEITAAGAVEWKQGDKLYVVGETQGLLGYVSAKADGDPATFEGNITALTSAQKLRFYYVGDKAFTLDDSGNYTFDLSAQDGTLEGIAAHNQLMHGQTTGTVAVGQTNFGQISMTSLMAIAHFKITADGVATSTFSISGGFATSTFNAKTCNGTITGTGTGNIAVTLTSPAVSTDCYVALLPGAQTLTFSNAGKETSLSEKTVEANQFYNSESPIEVEITVYEYVDLGLSVLWATCNVGADSPEEYGDYFAWGETVTKSSFNEFNYTYTGSSNLPLENDAAHVNWGGSWRMPSQAEMQELIDGCDWNRIDNYEGTGIKGYKVCNNNDDTKYIFIPFAGYIVNSSYMSQASNFYDWSSTYYDALRCYSLSYENSELAVDIDQRLLGFTVRPVRPKN